MNAHVPAHCHGVAAPFSTFALAFENVPGFIVGVIESSLSGALIRQGLEPAATDADLMVRSTLDLIEHHAPPARDPLGESVAPNELHRFVTHLTIDVTDQRSGTLIWTGSIDRAHAIHGGETFHDERAVLLISKTFDAMFVGLKTPCE